MAKKLYVLVHDWGDDYSVEVCESFSAAQASMRGIASEHFLDDGDEEEEGRLSEVLAEIAAMTGADDAGVTLQDGEVTIDLRITEISK